MTHVPLTYSHCTHCSHLPTEMPTHDRPCQAPGCVRGSREPCPNEAAHGDWLIFEQRTRLELVRCSCGELAVTRRAAA